MALRIRSNGTVTGTQVLDSDTGEDLTRRLRVQHITVVVDPASGDVSAHLVCAAVALDILAPTISMDTGHAPT